MLGVMFGLWWPKQYGLRAMTEIWIMGSKSPHTNMGYQQMYGLSQSMGYTPYGLYQSQLYPRLRYADMSEKSSAHAENLWYIDMKSSRVTMNFKVQLIFSGLKIQISRHGNAVITQL